MAEELEQVVEEQPKPSIYKFLKDNGLTTKDEATFGKEYSTPEKQKELYEFMKGNQLTTKDLATFSSDNFGAFKKYGQPKSSFYTRFKQWINNIWYAIINFPRG